MLDSVAFVGHICWVDIPEYMDDGRLAEWCGARESRIYIPLGLMGAWTERIDPEIWELLGLRVPRGKGLDRSAVHCSSIAQGAIVGQSR